MYSDSLCPSIRGEEGCKALERWDDDHLQKREDTLYAYLKGEYTARSNGLPAKDPTQVLVASLQMNSRVIRTYHSLRTEDASYQIYPILNDAVKELEGPLRESEENRERLDTWRNQLRFLPKMLGSRDSERAKKRFMKGHEETVRLRALCGGGDLSFVN